MAIKPCSICGKNVGFSDRYDLKDGYICDNCFEKVKTIDNSISPFKTNKYTVDKMKLILNHKAASNTVGYTVVLHSVGADEIEVIRKIRELVGYDLNRIKEMLNNIPCNVVKKVTKEYADEIKTALEKAGAVVEIQEVEIKHNEPSAKENEANQILEVLEDGSVKKEGGFFTTIGKGIKAITSAIGVILLIIGIILFANGKMDLIISDFLASDFGRDYIDSNPYIEMVQSSKPYDNTSYGEAFANEFDSNEWSYFKSDGLRIVQVVSAYNDIDDKMITQFLLTPQENDLFYIEPYAVNVSGKNLSDVEINMVIAAIFEGEFLNAIGELIFYSSLIN